MHELQKELAALSNESQHIIAENIQLFSIDTQNIKSVDHSVNVGGILGCRVYINFNLNLTMEEKKSLRKAGYAATWKYLADIENQKARE